ncbi:hypothetical protein FB446DRAFT_759678 [Lentinula raphanica]|nr:hypothetical protein FB446DRAFT_759678 [Lentinula raphanica]
MKSYRIGSLAYIISADTFFPFFSLKIVVLEGVSCSDCAHATATSVYEGSVQECASDGWTRRGPSYRVAPSHISIELRDGIIGWERNNELKAYGVPDAPSSAIPNLLCSQFFYAAGSDFTSLHSTWCPLHLQSTFTTTHNVRNTHHTHIDNKNAALFSHKQNPRPTRVRGPAPFCDHSCSTYHWPNVPLYVQTEPTPGTLSASHSDPAHRSDIVPQSTLDARTSELSADDRPLLLARAPEPGAMLSQIVQGPLAANVKCKNPENQDATRLALEKMLNCDPVHNHLKNALRNYKFQGVLLRKFEIDAGIGDPKYSLDQNRLNFKDQHCDVEILPDEYISLTLWATLRFTKHAPHDQTPYHAALGTVSKYRGNREAVTVVWVEFKMGNVSVLWPLRFAEASHVRCPDRV